MRGSCRSPTDDSRNQGRHESATKDRVTRRRRFVGQRAMIDAERSQLGTIENAAHHEHAGRRCNTRNLERHHIHILSRDSLHSSADAVLVGCPTASWALV